MQNRTNSYTKNIKGLMNMIKFMAGSIIHNCKEYTMSRDRKVN